MSESLRVTLTISNEHVAFLKREYKTHLHRGCWRNWKDFARTVAYGGFLAEVKERMALAHSLDEATWAPTT